MKLKFKILNWDEETSEKYNLHGVELSDIFAIVKEKLAEETELGIESFSLFDGETPLKDDKTLSDYGIDEAKRLKLVTTLPVITEVTIQVHNGSTFELDVTGDDTIEVVKAKVQEREGISVEQQWLFLEGNFLDDDSLSLKETIIEQTIMPILIRPSKCFMLCCTKRKAVAWRYKNLAR